MKALIIDFSRVLIFPKADNVDSLNAHHRRLSGIDGYSLFDHFYLNDELLEFLNKLSTKLPIYIFTDGNLHELPEVSSRLAGIFKRIFSVEKSGLTKKSSESFRELARRIDCKPDEIVFIDDKPANVKAAQESGMRAYVYRSNSQVIEAIKLESEAPARK